MQKPGSYFAYFSVLFFFWFSTRSCFLRLWKISCELGFCRKHPYLDSPSFLRLFSVFNVVPLYNAESGSVQVSFPPGEISRYVSDQKVFSYGNDCRNRDTVRCCSVCFDLLSEFREVVCMSSKASNAVENVFQD